MRLVTIYAGYSCHPEFQRGDLGIINQMSTQVESVVCNLFIVTTMGAECSGNVLNPVYSHWYYWRPSVHFLLLKALFSKMVPSISRLP